MTLDVQTRTLTRLSDGESVNLPASASLCLQALVEAEGEVLSQEQLMDIGWRSSGVEVTDNSVRVMINKLRRALHTLASQQEISLLAVTRSGYRLLIHEPQATPAPPYATDAPPQPTRAPQVTLSEALPLAAVQPKPRNRRWLRWSAAGCCGVILGLIVAYTLYGQFMARLDHIQFVPWSGPGVPADTQVFVPRDRQDQQALIEATLSTYENHVISKRPLEKPAKVLYITLGASPSTHHQGLIACQQPFQDAENDCESFYFKIY